MSNVFSGMSGAKGDNVEDDFIGGNYVLETNIYEAKVKTAYIGKSNSSKSQNVTLLLEVEKKEIRSQIWVSNRNGEVTYKDKKTKEDKNIPGFAQINSLCLLVCGKELGEMDVEELKVNIYDYDAKKEIPTSVNCLTELHGETLHVALQEQIIDKTAKNETTGNYDPTGETRRINEVIKFFPESKLVTISEVAQFIKSLGADFDETIEEGNLLKAINKMDDSLGVYAETWLNRNKGDVYDKSSGKKGNTEGKPFAGKVTRNADSKKKNSLFDD